MTANTYGRQVVIPLVNKSGGALAAGDVVIVDTSNNDAVTTTTSASSTTVVGIVQETIASNATGRVLLSGYAALVNVPSSVTRGHYAFTHTAAKQATGSASRAAGAFGQFLTGGTAPDAHIFGITDSSVTGLNDPMTTRGDIIVRNSSNVTARLGIGSSGKVLQSDGTDISWQTPAAGGITHSYLGYNTIGGSTQTPTAHRFYMKKVTVAAAGTIASIGIYYNIGNGNTPIIGAAVLSDVAGAPTAVLAHSAQLTSLGATAAGAHWIHMPIGLYVTAADYWLGVLLDTASGTMYYDTSASDSYYTSGGLWIGDAFYAVTTDTNKRYSLRADFLA